LRQSNYYCRDSKADAVVKPYRWPERDDRGPCNSMKAKNMKVVLPPIRRNGRR
jgi:hypothetical protein